MNTRCFGSGTLWMTLLLLLIASVIFAAATQEQQQLLQKQQEHLELFGNYTNDCISGDCDALFTRHHLQTLQRYMNTTADPCVDFHQYACGNWQHAHPNATITIKLADEQVTLRYVELFERWQQEAATDAAYASSQPDEFQSKLLQYFNTCRAVTHNLTLDGYFKQMYRERNDIWQLHGFDWLTTLAELGRYGYSSHFVQYEVRPQNRTSYQLLLLPHYNVDKLTLDAEIMALLQSHMPQKNDTLRQDLLDFEEQLLQLMEETHDVEDTAIDARDARNVPDTNNAADANYDNDTDELTYEQLNAAFSEQNIDWLPYLSAILGRKPQRTERVLVEKLNTLQAITTLLSDTRPEILMLYTMARFAQYLAKQQQILDASHTKINCVRHMRYTLDLPMSYVYERSYYASRRARDTRVIEQVFAQLKTQFARVLHANTMQHSEDELQYMQHKLQHMRINVGNQPIAASQLQQNYIRNLNVSSDNFYANHLNALAHFITLRNFLLAPHIDDNPLHTFLVEVPDDLDSSPFYTCVLNMIILPYGYLQLPFFSAHFVDALLYGDLGNTLAHELIHGFETMFLAVDAHGAYRSKFRSISENPNFLQNIECLNRIETKFISERIADVSGTHLSMATFMHDATYRHSNGRLFFLQFAQFFCGAVDVERYSQVDPYHDVDSERLNYVLGHVPEFAQVFDCPSGSPLNPTERCHMW